MRYSAKNIAIVFSLIAMPFLLISCGGGSDEKGTDDGGLETVKTFVSDFRTWGTVIGNDVQSKSSVFDAQLTAANTTFSVAEPLLGDAIRHATKAALFAYLNGNSLDLAVYFDPSDPVDPVTASGTATVAQNTVTVSGIINDVITDLTYVLPNLNGDTFTATVGGSVSRADASISVSTGTVTFNYANTVDISDWANGTVTSPLDPDSGSLDLSITLSQEGVADPISFTGNATLEILGSQDENGNAIRDSLGNVLNYNISSANFNGTFGNTTGDEFTALVKATMPNAATFFPLASDFYVGYVNPALGSYSFTNSNNTMTLTLPQTTYTFENDSANGLVWITKTDPHSTYADYYFNPYTTLKEFLDNNYYYVYPYEFVDGEGNYYLSVPAIWDTVGGTIAGTLERVASVPDEDATNYRELTDMELTFTAQLNGLPTATFTLTGNRTGFENGDVSLTIAYGNRSIVVNAQISPTEATGNIVITNQDGVRLIITQGAGNNGEITYNGVVYATITTTNGVTMIRYTDGSFETL